MKGDKMAEDYIGRQEEREALMMVYEQEKDQHSTETFASSTQRTHYVNLSEALWWQRRDALLAKQLVRGNYYTENKIPRIQNTKVITRLCGNQKTNKSQSSFPATLDSLFLPLLFPPALLPSLPLSSQSLPSSFSVYLSTSFSLLSRVLFCFHLVQYGSHP